MAKLGHRWHSLHVRTCAKSLRGGWLGHQCGGGANDLPSNASRKIVTSKDATISCSGSPD
jgi:hypothetical protein